MSKHVAVFIDHREAHIFQIDAVGGDQTTVRAPGHLHRKHPTQAQGAKEHPDDARRFFHDVCALLEAAEQVLIVGPSTAKLELLRYIHAHAHVIEPRIVGVETVDHPTDGQLVAFAKRYFGMPVRA